MSDFFTIHQVMKLPTPNEIKSESPCLFPERIAAYRRTAKEIVQREDPRLAAICGPCSIHDANSALEYAERLRAISKEISPSFFLLMRIFFEKPRTRLGWKGLLYDPHLDGTNDIVEGIRQTRKIILQIAEIGIPCASELLEPLLIPYFDDLIVWGLIGARTSASQPHRQMASGLEFPVGFKNGVSGDAEVAISGMLTASLAHSHIGINEEGYISKIQTQGNPYTHIVLRGSDHSPNYHQDSVQNVLRSLKEHKLSPRVMIDCSHGNCGKDHLKQLDVFNNIIDQAETNRAIMGFMLESNLFSGKQPLSDTENLQYGISITDPCIGWEETELLLRSRSMSFVQK